MLLKQRKWFNEYSIYAKSGTESISNDDLDRLHSLYRAVVTQIDQFFGQVFEILEDHTDETMIVITADHGENLGEDNTLSHQFSMSDALLEIPLIVFDPIEKVPEGDDHSLTQLHDLHTSIGKWASVDVPNYCPPPILESRDYAYASYRPSPSVLTKYHEDVPADDRRPIRQEAIKAGDSKLISYPNEGEIAGDKHLKETLADIKKGFKPIQPKAGSQELDEETLQQLEQLGYR